MELVNMTPHAIRLVLLGGEKEVTIPPSGITASVTQTPRYIVMVMVDGREFPAVATRFGELEGLPEPNDCTRFLVSAIAQRAACAMGRHDTLVPVDILRDEQGCVLGAGALQVCCEKACLR